MLVTRILLVAGSRSADVVLQQYLPAHEDDGSVGEHLDAERRTGEGQTRRCWTDGGRLDGDGRSKDSAAMDRRSKKIRSSRLSIDSDL